MCSGGGADTDRGRVGPPQSRLRDGADGFQPPSAALPAIGGVLRGGTRSGKRRPLLPRAPSAVAGTQRSAQLQKLFAGPRRGRRDRRQRTARGGVGRIARVGAGANLGQIYYAPGNVFHFPQASGRIRLSWGRRRTGRCPQTLGGYRTAERRPGRTPATPSRVCGRDGGARAPWPACAVNRAVRNAQPRTPAWREKHGRLLCLGRVRFAPGCDRRPPGGDRMGMNRSRPIASCAQPLYSHRGSPAAAVPAACAASRPGGERGGFPCQ